MDKPTRWKFLIEVFPNEMEEIVSSEVLTGSNPRGDDKLTRDIRAAEDVIDPARTPPPMGMEAILEAFAPLAPKPKPVVKAVTDAELTALKLAYADAFLAYEQTDVDDPQWDSAHDGWEDAGKTLWQAFRKHRKAGGR